MYLFSVKIAYYRDLLKVIQVILDYLYSITY